jgi:hypothetical protein
LPTNCIPPALVAQFRRAKKIAARMHHQSPFVPLKIANGFAVGPVPDPPAGVGQPSWPALVTAVIEFRAVEIIP